MKEHFYLRTNSKEVPGTSGIEKALNCKVIADEDKEQMTQFLTSLGYSVVEVDEEIKVFAPKTPILSTWDIRSESKRLLAYADLKEVCSQYLDKPLEEAYNDAEINEIVYMATRLPNYSCRRSEAVKEAFFMFVCGRKLKDLDIPKDDEIEEAEDAE